MVCVAFSLMNRMVDAFGADVPRDRVQRMGQVINVVGLRNGVRRGKPRAPYAGSTPPSVAALEAAIGGPDGDAPPPLRRAIDAAVRATTRGEPAPNPPALSDDVRALALTIADDAHAVTDAHVDALRGAWSEAAIYEMVFVASAAAGLARLELAWRAIAGA